jgi:hypothetical protein
MQSAGLSETVILSSINSEPAAYDTSTDGLLALKKGGVSDAVDLSPTDCRVTAPQLRIPYDL